MSNKNFYFKDAKDFKIAQSIIRGYTLQEIAISVYASDRAIQHRWRKIRKKLCARTSEHAAAKIALMMDKQD